MSEALETRSQPETLATLGALLQRRERSFRDAAERLAHDEDSQKPRDIVEVAGIMNGSITCACVTQSNDFLDNSFQELGEMRGLTDAETDLALFVAAVATDEAIRRFQGIPPGRGLHRLRQMFCSASVAGFLAGIIEGTATIIIEQCLALGDNS